MSRAPKTRAPLTLAPVARERAVRVLALAEKKEASRDAPPYENLEFLVHECAPPNNPK